MTGHGGWPLNVFLTPEQLPFYGGTYFPPEPRHGMPAWTQVLQAIAESWSERSEEIRAGGEQPARAAVRRRAACSPRPSRSTSRALDDAVERLRESFDADNGGFGARAEVPAGLGARVPAAARRARDDAARRCARWPAAASTTSSAAASPATASTAPGRCRTSRRCSTTTRCSRAPTCTAGRRFGERRLLRRLPGHARLGAARDARPRGRLLLGARRRLRGRRGPLLRVDARPSCATALGEDADAAIALVRRDRAGQLLRPAPPRARAERAAGPRERAPRARRRARASASASACSRRAPSACARGSTTSA